MIIKSNSYKHNKAFKTVVDYVLREAEQDDSFVLTRFIKGKCCSISAVLTFDVIIARQYLKLRSPLSVALVIAHRKEKDHVHLHILLSGVEYKTGKSVRISRDDFKNKVKLPAEQYVRKHFPELERSAINHQKSSKKKF